MPDLLPPVRLRKSVPISSDIRENLIGQNIRQKKIEARNSITQKADQKLDTIVAKLQARTRRTILDVLA